MLKDITIGQYIPGASPLHKMYPPLKIIMAVLYAVVLFIISKPLSYAVFTVYTLLLVIISGVRVRTFLKGLKPMLWILVFTAVLNLFLTPGETLWSLPLWGFAVRITREGVYNACLLSVRLVYLVVGTSLLTLTTSPLQLTDAIEKLLRPLRVIKVPSFEIAMMMTIALRFIPTLAEETDKIMKAQTARGADFTSGNIMQRARAMVPLLVPLFISAFRRADELATAMEARCFRGGEGRTRMKETRPARRDFIASAVFMICAAAMLIVEFAV